MERWVWNKNRYATEYFKYDSDIVVRYDQEVNLLKKKRIFLLSNFYLNAIHGKEVKKLLFILIKRHVKYEDNAEEEIYIRARQKLDDEESQLM